MTDEIQDLGVISDAAIQDSGATEQQETQAVEEKTLTQSQVNKIVAREKRDTELKVKSAYEQRMAELAAQSQQQQSSGQALTVEQIDARIEEKARIRAAQQNAAQIANAFEAKIKEAIQADPDFADDYDALNLESHPEIILMTNQLDNTAEVLKELSQNPSKFSSVLNLVKNGNPVLARRVLSSLSKSITTNKAALAQKKAAAPLGQIKSSQTQTGDGNYSVSSFRANPKYRG